MPRGIKKQTVQEQPKKKTWSRKKKVTEPTPTASSESSSSTPDLGSLHQELLQIRQESQQLQEHERELGRRKAEVEKELVKALKSIGISGVIDAIAPKAGGISAERGIKAARSGKGDGAGESKGKKGGGGPRYTDEERRAAVEFVDNEVEGGASITKAIAQYNKSGKPRGKAPMNYQSLLRWRQG